MKRFCIGLLLALLTFGGLSAQELLCSVDIQAPTQGSDKQIYDQMKEAITKYVNFRKWTDLTFEPQERIRGRIQLIINERPEIDEFRGSLQIQLIRPVYNSSYESIVLNIRDSDISFKFTAFQPLEFSENQYIDELTSILNFYAYMLIGFDCETFALSAGTPYFEKAQNIVNLAGSNGRGGWNNFDGQQNRYWLVTDMLDNGMSRIHNVFYTYHRQGLDQMERNLPMARKTILQSLRELSRVNQRYPAKYITRVFLTAKSAEIVQIFEEADLRDKQELIKIMEPLDPSRADDYASIMK